MGDLRRPNDRDIDKALEELDGQARLDLANVVASARLEGHEIPAEHLALAIEYLAGRIDAGTYRRRVRDTALGSLKPGGAS